MLVHTKEMIMGHEYVLWAVVIVCAAHVVDEHLLDFVGVVRSVGLASFSQTDFYVVNAAMITGAVACAAIGWRLPELSLIAPALIAWNTLLHVGGSLARRRPLPGLVTAVFFYAPTVVWVYVTAANDGVLTWRAFLISTAGGLAFMTLPVVFALLKQRTAGKKAKVNDSGPSRGTYRPPTPRHCYYPPISFYQRPLAYA
jgi:hypothetical protein